MRLLLALLLPVALVLTRWAFTSLEFFPLVFTVMFSLFVWVRPPLGTTRLERVAAARGAPLAAATLFLLAIKAMSGTFELSLLAFALIAFLPFPFDRNRLARLLSSPGATILFALVVVLVAWWILARLDLVPLAVGVVLSLLQMDLPRAEGALGSAWTPAILGLFSGLAVLWVWGSLQSVAAIHDEDAYLLQGRLFARGQWAAPSPPLPEFFEQFHVLVTPVFASKYPPGQSLVLMPGIWLGLPGLMPVALTGLTGALLFALARRLANGWVALLSWLVWTIAPGNLFYRASYMSEVTTSALWLVGWWALLNWRDRGRTSDLLLLSACVAWGLITRPLTSVVFALPAGFIVLRLALARRSWRDVAIAAALGAGILAILPVWSARTTGDWKISPLLLYTRQYMPYDLPGFGATRRPALRPLPPELAKLNLEMEETKRHHVVAAVPTILWTRLQTIVRDMWGWPNRFLIAFALLGLAALETEAALAVSTAALLVLAYLTYWHRSDWCVYYIEIEPVLAFLTALGVWKFSRILSGLLSRVHSRREAESRWSGQGLPAVIVISFAAIVVASSFNTFSLARSRVEELTRIPRSFRSSLLQIRGERSVVFVHYAPNHDGNRSLVANRDDLARARIWVVHDRGLDNGKLLEDAPDRIPYLYDEATRRLLPYPKRTPATRPS